MEAKEYKCQHCGHVEPLFPEGHEMSRRMFIDCPACGTRVGMKMVIDAPGIQKFGNQKGMSDWERIKNRPR